MTQSSKKLPIAAIDWIDSQSTRGWYKFNPQEDRDPCNIHSVGLIVDECKQSVSLSTSVSKNGNHMDVVTIPRVAIVKLKKSRM